MKRLFSLFITIITIIIVRAQTPADSIQYFNFIGEADKAIAKSEWTTAEQRLLDAMRLNPDNPTNILLMSNLGMIRFYAGKTEEAINTLNDAHNIAPASVTILQNRAHIYTEIGNNNQALEDYSLIIALDSTLIEPSFYHAILSLSSGDVAEATKDVARLKSIDSHNRLTYIADANLALHTARYSDAVSPLSRLIEVEPTAEYYAKRGLCRLLLSQLQDASDDIANGLQLDPAYAELYLYRALLNKFRFRPDDAKADAKRAIELGADAQRVNTLIN